ncbi:hypothetical protein K474DRAFT_1662933 [Panus rudis PR-1116 ss-1]|nr:hypothetical protein K474DRAFT_1662933 [Panus rudis PR-1116 ss-1]
MLETVRSLTVRTHAASDCLVPTGIKAQLVNEEFSPHSIYTSHNHQRPRVPTQSTPVMRFTTTFTTFITTLLASLALLLTLFTQQTVALPVTEELEKRDVFVPKVLYPHAGTTWYKGQRHNVTWDISNPPQNITNRFGMILLRKDNSLVPLFLAKGFDILDGRVEVDVPWVITGSTYSLVLFGDSGNFSPQFTIVGDDL